MKTLIKIFAGIAFIAVVAGGGYFLYITRPVEVTDVATPDSSVVVDTDATIYTLDNATSYAEFYIYEELRGEPVTVVGTTSSITANLSLNKRNPAASSLGTIAIDARTFITDNERRNAAIARTILKAEEAGNEFITFTVRSISGDFSNVSVDTDIAFSVEGTMTIAGVARDASFDVVASLDSDGAIRGIAQATVLRSNFGILVPNLSFLANVADEVPLVFSFTLVPQR